jgi:phage gpG-like protein
MGGTAETYAKKACPVDTGRLRSSITHQKQDEDTMLVGSNVEYAPYVELGHSQEPGRYVPAIKKRLVASHVDGKPFLRPAIENHTAEYVQIIENEMKHA